MTDVPRRTPILARRQTMAELLDVSERTFSDLVQRGVVPPPCRREGRMAWWDVEEVRRWMREAAEMEPDEW